MHSRNRRLPVNVMMSHMYNLTVDARSRIASELSFGEFLLSLVPFGCKLS